MPIRLTLKKADRNSINSQILITSCIFLSKVTHIYPRLLTAKVKTVRFFHPIPFRKFRLILRMMKKMINPITERPLRPGTRFHAPQQMRLMPEQNIPVIRLQKVKTDTVKKLRLAAQKISHCAPLLPDRKIALRRKLRTMRKQFRPAEVQLQLIPIIQVKVRRKFRTAAKNLCNIHLI